ncbi:MAG: phosphopentomutase [Clostridia bacterium]|nr:phosphopentomutase [Clostridia bacterium]
MKRIFLIVLDSCGCGEADDAALFGDEGSHTLKSVYNTGKLNIPNMLKMGLGNIDSLSFLGREDAPIASWGKCAERSVGKDTTTGHWEMAGVISEKPFPTYPAGFPDEIIQKFRAATGRGVLCNKPYSGTEAIRDYGDEHIKSGDFIVYTSADSVFQIAAHEDVVPLDELYFACRKAREILCGEHAVARVIARPFTGASGSYKRTASRRDFSLAPPHNMLDDISLHQSVIAVGKITDIFAGRGMTRSIMTHSNTEGICETIKLLGEDFTGLCFTNLVDFDMLYGHRNDAVGYANALNEFDAALPAFFDKMQEGDLLIITADHGCDPGDKSTDHTRENVPLLIYSKSLAPKPLGKIEGFDFISKFVLDKLGTSLLNSAFSAAENAYAPYSSYRVGAALEASDGTVFTGFNIENAAYSPTICAERSAFVRAICEGYRSFSRIAVTSAPCGVCRQFMREFCSDDFEIITPTMHTTLSALLPSSFGAENLR